MGVLLRILAPVGALALGFLLVVGVAGMVVRLPWEPPCVVRASTGEPMVQGSVADMRQYVAEVAGPPAEPAGSQGAQVGLGEALGSGPVLTCTIEPIAATDVPKDLPVGLTPRARALRAEVREVFGKVPTGGYGPQEVLPGRAAGGEHSLGRAIDFFYRPADDRSQQRRGWTLANWAVANAERLGIRTVIYSDHIWSARRSAQGWRDYRFSGPNPDSPVNRHLDHVHIDVA